MSHDFANKLPAFQLKASLYTLTTLHLLATDLETLSEQLGKLRHQAPKFLNNTPVIVDLQRLKADTEPALNFDQLKQLLSQHQLIIVGLRHVPEAWQESAKNAGFALLPNATQNKTGARSTELPSAKPLSTEAETTKNTPPEQVQVQEPLKTTAASSMVIQRSVRSGQQIYAKNADLIVIGSVSPGAELIADGNIHIYGQLNGRALAGASDNAEARIFCQRLAAELVSIAGHYWLHEDVMAHAKGQTGIQIYLDQEQLHLAKL